MYWKNICIYKCIRVLSFIMKLQVKETGRNIWNAWISKLGTLQVHCYENVTCMKKKVMNKNGDYQSKYFFLLYWKVK